MTRLAILIICISIASISAGQQLINGGFEKWAVATRTIKAVGWSNDLQAALYHSPGRDAVKDSFALVLSTWYSYVEGHLFYGEHNDPDYQHWTNYTVPFKWKPDKLTGYFRYTDPVNETDSAGCSIIIKDIVGDTLAFAEMKFDTTKNWTLFEIPLHYYKGRKDPATIAIHFVSRVNGAGMNHDSYPNRLWLDELKFIYGKKD